MVMFLLLINEDGVKAKISMRINGDVSFTDAS